MKIAIASDHAGYDVKEQIKKHYGDQYEWLDLGTDSEASVDYPDFGHKLAQAVEQNEVAKGIIICGTGIGISIAANRHKGVRAALCTNATMAKLTRLHNDANVLALGARITGFEVILDCVDAFMGTEFEGGRHERRVNKLDD
ncbi:MAG TPA: ribose 5-phosphate isomerase B [Micavibrio sp.]|nr:ribose 5-phosphate isomerase B [Micavibrio sp.]HIL28571.1 ribose 5-phosphate isomerase B [Micavibrio sp.]